MITSCANTSFVTIAYLILTDRAKVALPWCLKNINEEKCLEGNIDVGRFSDLRNTQNFLRIGRTV